MKNIISLLPAAFACALLGVVQTPAKAAPPASSATHAGHGATATAAPEPVVTALMSKDLPDIPGKEGLALLVVYPPGGADPVHRHDADAFVYVLEGSIVMQVEGGPEVTLKPGEMFYEGPKDIHTVGRNASQTEPAKFVVVLVKNKGVPPVLPPK
ncbi:cupin domain-containing protein [Bordetella sp. LUAb4]|uniref:cupin domain-containing protein n=1 Tax=Bordetella sp. LUAb4 TaxID=2843195 RepID=UPI001E483D81|nr:cupin domain-containing protein [Bordetella sp. LUAb4]